VEPSNLFEKIKPGGPVRKKGKPSLQEQRIPGPEQQGYFYRFALYSLGTFPYQDGYKNCCRL
jgi:hypothetical protein